MDQSAPTLRTPPRAVALLLPSDMQGSEPNCRCCEGSSERVSIWANARFCQLN